MSCGGNFLQRTACGECDVCLANLKQISESTGLAMFACSRGASKDLVKIQLEIPARILSAYKDKANGSRYSPKQIMENMLTNWIDGVSDV